MNFGDRLMAAWVQGEIYEITQKQIQPPYDCQVAHIFINLLPGGIQKTREAGGGRRVSGQQKRGASQCGFDDFLNPISIREHQGRKK